MAVGATIVIISGGIDLSVGSVYALAGVAMGLILRVAAPGGGVGAVLLAFVVCVAVGIAAGALNGAMVVGLRVHPFIITLGIMWILRGIAFVDQQGREHPAARVAHPVRQVAARAWARRSTRCRCCSCWS